MKQEFSYNDGTADFPPFVYVDEKKAAAAIFESAEDASAAAADFADKQLKAQGMSCALEWLDAGDFSLDALDALVQGIADLDGDGEIQEGGEEETYYNDLFGAVANAMASLGADADAIGKFIDDEDTASGEAIGSLLSEKMNAVDQPDESIITDYTLGATDPVMESTVKVVRGGKVVLKKKRLRRVKLSSAQRAGLKKARMKAFTSVAKHARAKSMKIRKSRGMK